MEKLKRRIILHNLGCKTNRYEADAVLFEFLACGFEKATTIEEADICIINTCTVTGEAGRKSMQQIRRFRKKAPRAIIVAMGCHAQLNDLSGLVDLCFGTSERKEIVKASLEALEAQSKQNVSAKKSARLNGLGKPLEQATYEDTGVLLKQTETRAQIKIQDGCDAFCSYCIIPLARGRVRSRERSAILKEAAGLIQAGYKELVLTGIHICSFEKDKDNAQMGLATLVTEISALEGDFRIRLGSLDPSKLTAEFVRVLASAKKLCPHFHLSLQSGSDRVLQLMRRHYKGAEVLQASKTIREYLPNASLTADVIVGFPGETDADFADTMAVCQALELMKIHIFRYSMRNGTVAATMANQVAPSIKAERSRALQVLADAMEKHYLQQRLGTVASVLLETEVAPGVFQGTSEDYITVEVLADNKNWQSGDVKMVSVVEVLDNAKVVGQAIPPCAKLENI